MADAHKYQAHEVLNRVLNAGEDGLNVDLADSVTVTVDSEFPAAAALADNSGNPTTTSVGSHLLGYDSGNTNWNRVEVDDVGHLQVDVLTITAGDNNIGNVDIASALPAGSNTIGVVDLGSTDNAVLDAMAASLALLDNSISSGNELQVDIVASLPAGSAAIGKLAANSGVDIGDVDILSIAAGDNNIGNVDIVTLPASTNTIEIVGDAAEDAAVAGNPVLTGGRYDTPGNDNASVRSLDNGDVGALALDPTGALYVREHLGQAGSCFVSGTAAVTAAYGKFVAIQFLEDTVFNGTNGLVATDTGRWPDDSAAASDVSSSNTAAVGSQSFPQGMTIFGRWDSFILVSGAVIAYVGNV